jgi:hypothetical protein
LVPHDGEAEPLRSLEDARREDAAGLAVDAGVVDEEVAGTRSGKLLFVAASKALSRGCSRDAAVVEPPPARDRKEPV